MTTSYLTPQRTITAHIGRFVLRCGRLVGASSPGAEQTITPLFTPQVLALGERRSVRAEYFSAGAIECVEARFTLYANGEPVVGYTETEAAVSSVLSSRAVAATVSIDLTGGSLYPGSYRGEFVLSTAGGQRVAAAGEIEIVDIAASPPVGRFITGGGVG